MSELRGGGLLSIFFCAEDFRTKKYNIIVRTVQDFSTEKIRVFEFPNQIAFRIYFATLATRRTATRRRVRRVSPRDNQFESDVWEIGI